MRYRGLACDYDGTIACHGRVDDDTVAALTRVRASSRRLILVTGRQLDDLQGVFERLDLFDRVVVENGAVIYDPARENVRAIADPPTPAFGVTLAKRGVDPLAIGRVIVATSQAHERTVRAVIRDLQLDLQVILNKNALMVLPSGIDKATGLGVACDELGLAMHDVVAVGDAENDRALLERSGLGVAMADAVPMLKQHADWVTRSVVELADALVATDLAEHRWRGAR
jgi:hydroxymethylpyrimidine pyrophosphatase-like HAD family hydrolase